MRIVSWMMVALLLMGTFALAFNVVLVHAQVPETVYINSDGSITPSSAPISSVDCARTRVKGLGTKLLWRLIKEGKTLGIDNLLVNISSRNKASIDFHKKQGFHECGRFRNIGRKFGKDFDVLWMQLTINQ